MVDLVRRHDGLLYFRGVARVQHNAREWLEKKTTGVALEESFCEHTLTGPRRTRINFFSKHITAAFALAVSLVEGLHLVGLWRELVFVPFDCFEVKLGV